MPGAVFFGSNYRFCFRLEKAAPWSITL